MDSENDCLELFGKKHKHFLQKKTKRLFGDSKFVHLLGVVVIKIELFPFYQSFRFSKSFKKLDIWVFPKIGVGPTNHPL